MRAFFGIMLLNMCFITGSSVSERLYSARGDVAHINGVDQVNYADLTIIDDIVILSVPSGKVDLDIKELRKALK